MRIIITRHGDPDYSTDRLTERGKLEAAALAERMKDVRADYCYVSPMGRAQETASYSLEKMGMEAKTLEWLHEFIHPCKRPHDTDTGAFPWDWKPADWTVREEMYDRDRWAEGRELSEGNIKYYGDQVAAELDGLLKKHGYERDGQIYRAVRSNHDVIVLFCHFGIEAVILGHLLGISPMVLWQNTCSMTTGYTEVVTEERDEGIASFRMLTFGDVSHLAKAGLEPSFAARFCECYEDDTRH